jgi:signal transduction histidine kinase
MIQRRTLIQRLSDRFPDVDSVEEVVEALIGAAPVGLMLIRNRIIEWADTSLYRMLGYKRGTLLGKSWHIFFNDPNGYDEVCEGLFSFPEAGVRHEEAEWVANDNRILQCYLRAAPVDRRHPARGHVVAALDITGWKRTEKLLRKSERRLRLLSSKLVQAQEDERRALARELHDGIGGKLTAIKYGIENVLNQPEPARTEEGISPEDIISVVNQAIDETRRVSRNLRPSGLDDLGLIRTISGLCRDLARLSGVSIEKDFDLEEGQLSDVLKITIYRILQEALNNAVKHSHADRIQIRLAADTDHINLAVEDNGNGFLIEETIPTGTDDQGVGIDSMRERAELTGGRLTLRSEPRRGTTVHVRWPHHGTTTTS